MILRNFLCSILNFSSKWMWKKCSTTTISGLCWFLIYQSLSYWLPITVVTLHHIKDVHTWLHSCESLFWQSDRFKVAKTSHSLVVKLNWYIIRLNISTYKLQTLVNKIHMAYCFRYIHTHLCLKKWEIWNCLLA